MIMKTSKTLLAIAACVLLASGCTTTRSISNSSYRSENSSYVCNPPIGDPAFAYRGELSEFDVLGITRGDVATETDIQRALQNAKPIRLKPGSSILLIQSGATLPDAPMVTELDKHFRVVPFSGAPPKRGATSDGQYESFDAQSYSKSLRLAAARGGNDFILCYWGVLESTNEKLVTKTVSWVPVVNWFVPDESEHMRIRLKLALVDVRTGDWAVLSPEPFKDNKISVSPRRDVADQKLVEKLKTKAYEASVRELVQKYSELAVR